MSNIKFQRIENDFLKIFNDMYFQENLSKRDFDRYMKSKEIMNLKKGDIVFEQGCSPEGVFFIESGKVKLYKHGFLRKEQILRFCLEGDLLGYRSLLCNEEFGASAEIISDTAIVTFLPRETFLHLLEVNSKLSYSMLQKIAYELGESSKTITYLAQKTSRERLAEVFLLLEQKLGTDPEGFINICLTRDEIASLIGSATESAIRHMSEFKNDGIIIVEGRSIKIINHSKLRKIGHVSF